MKVGDLVKHVSGSNGMILVMPPRSEQRYGAAILVQWFENGGGRHWVHPTGLKILSEKLNKT